MKSILGYTRTSLDTFDERPFCQVDSLVLSSIAYTFFPKEILPEGDWNGIHFADLLKAECFEQMFHGIWNGKSCLELLIALACSPRFRDILICGYTQKYDDATEKQFSAVTFRLTPDTSYIAFRGTDSSIIGWKEDFNMAFQDPIAGQLEAIRYLHKAASHFPGMLYLGGHSKGGNLAVYSAVKSDPSIRRRILDVYSHDGPGFLKSFFELPEYEQMKDRIHKTVPQSSLVGMLFETQEDYKVVKSRAFSLFQHDPASWVVNGNDFAYADHLNSGARHMDETLNTWILGLSPADRERFVDTLFELLNSTDVFSTEELVQNWSANLQILMQAARALDPESREFLQRTIRNLFTISLKTIPDRFRKK